MLTYLVFLLYSDDTIFSLDEWMDEDTILYYHWMDE